MNVLLVLPLLIPLGAAGALLLVRQHLRPQRWVALAGSLGSLAAAIALLVAVLDEGILVLQMGGWSAPFGITLVADRFSAAMVLVASIVGLSVAVYSLFAADEPRIRFGYYPLIQILMMGVSGAFLTGDLFNLYVWFEVMLIASFVLLSLGGRAAQIEAALKYVTLNLLSSILFLSAVGIIYGAVGTLNMADIAVRLDALEQPGLVTVISMLFLTAFGIKAAIFPLFSWLPASYHTPPAAISALFAGLLTKVGVYALIRMFTLMFDQDPDFTQPLILGLAMLTMVSGVLGAMIQTEFRRILSFHIVSQIGYMIMGLGLGTVLGLAGAIFYMTHHIIVKTTLFLVSGVVARATGSYRLADIGGLYSRYWLLPILFLVPALSLAGIPPFSGFFAKLALVQAGLDAEAWLVVAVALAVSLATLYSMTKIWAGAFWSPPPEPADARPLAAAGVLRPLLLPVAAMACLTIAIGVAAEPVYQFSLAAAEDLIDPSAYIDAVLGPAR